MRISISVMIILIFFFMGCIDFSSPSSVVSISDINEHPNRYLGSVVTIRGFYSTRFLNETGVWWYFINEDYYGFSSISSVLADSVDSSILIQGGEYYWHGVILQKNSKVYLLVDSITPT